MSKGGLASQIDLAQQKENPKTVARAILAFYKY